jgi:hypothetical protein
MRYRSATAAGFHGFSRCPERDVSGVKRTFECSCPVFENIEARTGVRARREKARGFFKRRFFVFLRQIRFSQIVFGALAPFRAGVFRAGVFCGARRYWVLGVRY